MRILKCRLRSGRVVFGQCVIRYRSFLPSICILIAIYVILRKIRCFICPAGCLIKPYRRSECDAILHELYFHFRRALAVLVIRVIPGLCDLRRCSFNGMVIGVLDRSRSRSVSCICILIVCRYLLLPLVIDLNAVLIYRKIRDRICPVITIIQRYGSDRSSICQKIDNDRTRLCCTITCIDPGLRDCQRHFFRLMGIGKCRRCSNTCFFRSVIRYTFFFPGVIDQSAVFVFRKVTSAIGPGITVIQFDYFKVRAILLQGHVQ